MTQDHKPKIGHIVLPQTGQRLYSEDFLLQPPHGLGALGMSKRSFRALLRHLRVPTLEIGKTRYVDALSFSIAMRAILRVGKPDFAAPGSDSVRRGTCTTPDLEPPEGSELRDIIAELIGAHRLASSSFTPEEIRDAATQAADRLRASGLAELPFRAQSRFHERAVADLTV